MRQSVLLGLSVLVLAACSSDPASPEPVQAAAPTEPQALVYRQHVIGFDDATEGMGITDRYAKWAKFSSSPGCTLQATHAADAASSQPNFLFGYNGCVDGDKAPIFVDFEMPVAQIGFTLVGVNDKGKVAKARYIKADGTATEVDLNGEGDMMMPVVVESKEANIVRLEIVDIDDPRGLGLDDLVFMFPEAE